MTDVTLDKSEIALYTNMNNIKLSGTNSDPWGTPPLMETFTYRL